MVAIFVVLTILVFLAVDYIVLRAQLKRLVRGEVVRSLGLIPIQVDEDLLRPRPRYPLHDKGFDLPQGLFYNRGHTWVHVRPSGEVRLGVDDFAQALIGRIDSVDLPPIGKEIRRGHPILKLKQGERYATFVSPVDGVVTSVNESLIKHSGALKQTPYQHNWLVTVKPKSLSGNVKQLVIADEAVEWLRGELRRFRDFISGAAPQVAVIGETLQDGGQPIDGVLEKVEDRVWENFQKEFLTV